MLANNRYPTGNVTLQQARLMRWPMRPFSDGLHGRPIGELITSALIFDSELKILAEQASDPRLREAGKLLLQKELQSIVSPATSNRGHAQVYAGTGTYMRTSFGALQRYLD